MGSRREEERNEKIIRGLMKLPPNRKCINCNSSGPQYVCTNFWTFVCMTCSGIHREFTHRVKSVSMAKFTSQEVESLQNGGNQRAREAYLNDWDTQRQRLPDSSNADKVRQFIKQVYVEKKYDGRKNSDKPPKDVQGIRNQEADTRRPSSNHSYSQSLPYDYQYEERRYGKQNACLTRKPGSDGGLYEGKMSSIIYSPGRLSENACENTLANEGSGARFSDYSTSSGGDPFRSDALSPDFQKDVGFGSFKPSVSSGSLDRHTTNRSLEANFRRDADGIPRPQSTASLGSFGLSGSNSASLKSFNSRSLDNPVSEPEQDSATRQDKSSTAEQSTLSGNTGIDLFQAPFESEFASSSSVDLFQAPQTFSTGSNDILHPFLSHPSSSSIQHQTPKTATPVVDFFADFPQQPTDATLAKKSPEPSSSSKNEGWATFDSPQFTTSVPASDDQSPVNAFPGGGSVEKLDLTSSFENSMKWPLPQQSDWQEPSPSVKDPWLGNLYMEAPFVISNIQTWNAFGEATEVAPLSEGSKHNIKPLVKLSQPESPAQHLGFEVAQDLNIYGPPRPATGPPSYNMPSNDILEAPHASAVPPLMGNGSIHTSGSGYKSSNPFDIPYNNDIEYDMFLDMSSLQSALPADTQVLSTFIGGATHSWFPQNSGGTYAPSAPQGALADMGGQTATTQIPNVAAQGLVASIGGNPFA